MMQAISSVNLYKVLQRRFSEEEAELIVSSLGEIAREGLATWEDLINTRAELKEDIAALDNKTTSLHTRIAMLMLALGGGFLLLITSNLFGRGLIR